MKHIVDGIRLSLYAGAAKQDANTEQSKRLRDERKEKLDVYKNTGDTGVVMNWIYDVMGSDWKPSQEWQDSIDHLENNK